MQSIANHFSCLIKDYPFFFKQSPLHFSPTLKAAKTKIGKDCPMTGNYKRERISGHNVSYCPCSTGCIRMRRNEPVSAHTTAWNRVLRAQNGLLKFCALRQINDIQRKLNVISFKRNPNRRSYFVNFLAGGYFGIRVKIRRLIFSRQPRFRKQNSNDSGRNI